MEDFGQDTGGGGMFGVCALLLYIFIYFLGQRMVFYAHGLSPKPRNVNKDSASPICVPQRATL